MSTARSVRTIREPIKKPRPLRSTSSNDLIKAPTKDTALLKPVEDVFPDLEILNVSISNDNFDEVTVADISRMCSIIKKRGHELETCNKDAMDGYLCNLRRAARDDRLDMISRLKLMQVIELKNRKWAANDSMIYYYDMKITELEQQSMSNGTTTPPAVPASYLGQNQNSSQNVTSVPLAHGEILRSSGKFAKPTKIAGKNYFQDEIKIRNSDSGKVNAGARDRLVQITGPNEESINHAKILVEDTIRRNTSPIRSPAEAMSPEVAYDNASFRNQYLDNQQSRKSHALQHSYSVGDATFKEPSSYTVQIGNESVSVSSSSGALLKAAKLVLQHYLPSYLDAYEKNTIRVPSPKESERYEIKKQSSVLRNMENHSSVSSAHNSSGRSDSLSPFSSSDDGDVQVGRKNSFEKTQGVPLAPATHALNVSLHSPISGIQETKLKKISLPSQISMSPNEHRFIRSSSVPNEFPIDGPQGSTVLIPPPSAPVHSPSAPIPPPSALIPPPIPPPSAPIPPPMQTYSRKFLLKCAKSPSSHLQPNDYVDIHKRRPEIICERPQMFDINKYESWSIIDKTSTEPH